MPTVTVNATWPLPTNPTDLSRGNFPSTMLFSQRGASGPRNRGHGTPALCSPARILGCRCCRCHSLVQQQVRNSATCSVPTARTRGIATYHETRFSNFISRWPYLRVSKPHDSGWTHEMLPTTPHLPPFRISRDFDPLIMRPPASVSVSFLSCAYADSGFPISSPWFFHFADVT
ncbi:hypothetical protein SCLCIDRAFT_154547 [Scleroderma citrinum Foug A]|uniref:Uncharacterized protein n=1 Tax=Scleroderma citrinum Foug A TaxID=1036808 RepID=A0A0C3EQX8_9AGAM|nr:hypothetical protein SCLCIDRAFT_154547 [Scleroderma citrinum Foug A]